MIKLKKKIRIGIIFGGMSVEHEVSLVSANSVINALDKNKYEVVPIGISHKGQWLSSSNALQLLKNRINISKEPEMLLLPDPRKKSLININENKNNEKRIDVIFPVVHGTYAEDGVLQGLLEMADIPYVGAGVLGSAVGMDKIVQKDILRQANIPVVKSKWFIFSDYKKNKNKIILDLEKLKYPMFVKPSNSGSSVGISKAHNRKELVSAIDLASNYDRKILIEEAVKNVREIECGILGNDNPKASVLGEIIPSNEFYDYDAKYVDGKSASVIPAKLPANISKKIQELAIKAYKVLDCACLARVDFLINSKTNKIFLNEINTLPGFTSISMYPKMWEATGIPYSNLLDNLIQFALERYTEKKKLKTTFTPKLDWYQK